MEFSCHKASEYRDEARGSFDGRICGIEFQSTSDGRRNMFPFTELSRFYLSMLGFEHALSSHTLLEGQNIAISTELMS